MTVHLFTDEQLTDCVFLPLNPYIAFPNVLFLDDDNTLYFTHGVWQLSQYGVEILEIGTKIVIAMPSLKHGWQRRGPFDIAESALVSVESGQAPPRRADLGDRDESLWEVGTSGQPRDPWEKVVQFNCTTLEDGRPLIFTGNTPSGRDAIAPICKEYGYNVRDHPYRNPIVELRAYADPNDWGVNVRPEFRLVGWKDNESLVDDGTPLPEAEAPDIPAPKTDEAA